MNLIEILNNSLKTLWYVQHEFPNFRTQEVKELLAALSKQTQNPYITESIPVYTLEGLVVLSTDFKAWQPMEYSIDPKTIIQSAKEQSQSRGPLRIRIIGTDHFWQFENGKLHQWNHEDPKLNHIFTEQNLYLSPPPCPATGETVQAIVNLSNGVVIGNKGKILQTRSRSQNAGGIDYLIEWESPNLIHTTNPNWANFDRVKILDS